MAGSPNAKKSRELELLIADAQRQFDVNGKVQHMSFWAYKLMCRSSRGAYRNPPIAFPDLPPVPSNVGTASNYIISGPDTVDYCAWHRYSDFEWLVEKLEHEFPGIIFPPLPPKETDATKDKVADLVSSKENDNPKFLPFVQARMRQLNMFCQVLMDISEVHDCDHLRAFIVLEESQWIAYKEIVDKRLKGSGLAAVGNKLSGFFSKVANRNVVVYDDVCEFGLIRQRQAAMSENMRLCQYRMKDVENLALNQPKDVTDLQAIFIENRLKPLAYPLITNGHFVSLGEKKGTVKHVDAQHFAYVQWHEMDAYGTQVPSSAGIERVPLTMLQYPESGISDPAVFAAVEASTQIESFFAYIQHRAESRDLEKLIDLLWFWRAYCERVPIVLKAMSDIEVKRQDVAKDVSSTKDVTKKQIKMDEEAKLAQKFSDAELRFKRFYATLFRPLQKLGLFNINLLVGRVSYNLLNDDDWPSRFARCDKALNPDFDIPAEVTALMQALARGESGQPPTAATATASSSSSSPKAAKPKPVVEDSTDSDDDASAKKRKKKAKAAAEDDSQGRSESIAPAAADSD